MLGSSKEGLCGKILVIVGSSEVLIMKGIPGSQAASALDVDGVSDSPLTCS